MEVILWPGEQTKWTKVESRNILASYFNILTLELQLTCGVTKIKSESITYKPECVSSWFCRETLTCCRMASHTPTHKQVFIHSCFSAVMSKQESSRVERITEWFSCSLDLKKFGSAVAAPPAAKSCKSALMWIQREAKLKPFQHSW